MQTTDRNSRPLKILIVRRDNIGDLVCTTPIFEAIRRQYPHAYIAALVNSYNQPVLEGNPYLDAVFAYTKGKHAVGESIWHAYLRRAKLLWQLRRMQFDYAILATSGFALRSLKLVKLLAPRHTIGFVTDEKQALLIDQGIPQGEVGKLHETEDMFRLLTPLGIAGPIPGLTVKADQNLRERLLRSLPDHIINGDGPLIALHISARKEKQRWPVQSFTDLAQHLHARHGARFLVFWSPGDENNPFHPGDDRKAKQLLDTLSGKLAVAIHTDHLSELMAGLSLCDTAILSDGGAMHIAAGLGKPLLCFFGNSPAYRWHPWGVPYRLIQKPSQDVKDIAPDEAADAFAELLAINKAQ